MNSFPASAVVSPGVSLRSVRVRTGGRAAFTLTELLTVIAIIGVLAAILIPVVGKVRQASQRSACSSNLRQTGVALTGFMADHRGRLPGYEKIKDNTGEYYGITRAAGPRWWVEGGNPTRDLVSQLLPYFSVNRLASLSNGIVSVLVCPANAATKDSLRNTGPVPSYYLSAGVRVNTGVIRRPFAYAGQQSIHGSDIVAPGRAVALFDIDAEFLAVLGHGAISNAEPGAAHGRTRNVLFFDGHVASVDKDVNPHEKL